MIKDKIETRPRSNTVPIRPIEFKRKRSDSFQVGTTPTNTPLTPLFNGMSSKSFSDTQKKEEFHVGSFVLGSKFSSTKLFEMDRL
jgi:hypothetical protein